MIRLPSGTGIFLFAILAATGPELISPHGEDEDGLDGNGWQHQDAWSLQELSLATAGNVGGVTSFGTVTGQSGHADGPPGHSHASSNSTLKGGSVPHVLIIYHSLSGHTEHMANVISNGALDLVPPCHIEVLPVQKANYTVLTDWADVLVVGSPVLNRQAADEILAYLRGMADLKALERLRGAAFVTAGGIGGGQELVIDQLTGAMQSLGIEPLTFPDCRYQLGLSAITGFAPFCRAQTDGDSCGVPRDAPKGQVHSKFEEFGYEYGRSLIRMLSDPNAANGPY